MSSEPKDNISLFESDASSDGGYETPSDTVLADDERPPSPLKQCCAAIPSSAVVVVVVDSEIQERIVKQVEWYFSDENLVKDSFLMKHIHRNKQGFVSLKLVASFRRVKSLTKDWTAVQASLKHSSFLELSQDGSKVRRKTPLPIIDSSHASRTVIVKNHPDAEPNCHDIEGTFSEYGEVSSVRILHPGKALPVDVKACRTNHPTLGKKLCILIEFNSVEGAEKACSTFKSQQSWRDQLTVALLSKMDHQSQENRKRQDHSPSASSHKVSTHQKTKEHSPTSRHSKERKHKRTMNSLGLPRKHLTPNRTDRECLSDSGCSVGIGHSPKTSPNLRRKFFCDQSLPSWRSQDKHTKFRECHLIRQPLGPDGTPGFIRN